MRALLPFESVFEMPDMLEEKKINIEIHLLIATIAIIQLKRVW